MKKGIRDGLTNITNKQEGKKLQFTPPERYDFKTCEKLTHCSRAKSIIGEII